MASRVLRIGMGQNSPTQSSFLSAPRGIAKPLEILTLTGCRSNKNNDHRWRPTRHWMRSEEHTSELQSRLHLVCRLLLEKKTEHTALGSRLSHSQSLVNADQHPDHRAQPPDMGLKQRSCARTELLRLHRLRDIQVPRVIV